MIKIKTFQFILTTHLDLKICFQNIKSKIIITKLKLLEFGLKKYLTKNQRLEF